MDVPLLTTDIVIDCRSSVHSSYCRPEEFGVINGFFKGAVSPELGYIFSYFCFVCTRWNFLMKFCHTLTNWISCLGKIYKMLYGTFIRWKKIISNKYAKYVSANPFLLTACLIHILIDLGSSFSATIQLIGLFLVCSRTILI